MAYRLLSLLPFASTTFLGSTRGLVLLRVTADILVYDVDAHIEWLRGKMGAHFSMCRYVFEGVCDWTD